MAEVFATVIRDKQTSIVEFLSVSEEMFDTPGSGWEVLGSVQVTSEGLRWHKYDPSSGVLVVKF